MPDSETLALVASRIRAARKVSCSLSCSSVGFVIGLSTVNSVSRGYFGRLQSVFTAVNASAASASRHDGSPILQRCTLARSRWRQQASLKRCQYLDRAASTH